MNIIIIVAIILMCLNYWLTKDLREKIYPKEKGHVYTRKSGDEILFFCSWCHAKMENGNKCWHLEGITQPIENIKIICDDGVYRNKKERDEYEIQELKKSIREIHK